MPSHHRWIVGVMGPGSGASLAEMDCAYELGRAIGQQNWILLTGGRAVGVMDAASRGAKAAGGLTIGILPGIDTQGISPAVDIPILTGLSHARNAINVLTSQVVIACGMGAGTASEVALALKSSKPVILLQVPPSGQAFFQALAPQQVTVAKNVDQAIALTQQHYRHQNPDNPD